MMVAKRIVAFLLMIGTVLALNACDVAEEKGPYAATQADIDYLNSKYENRVAYFGDLHDHSKDADYIINDKATKAYADEWIAAMDELDLDFQAIVNHKQVYHMYVDEWDNSRLIGGTEPATMITDSKALQKEMHYNMIVPNPEALIRVLQATPKFNYTGGKNGIAENKGTFAYANFTTAEMQELIQKVKDEGGLWVHVHPKQYMRSDDPLDYWFADYTGLEVFYVHRFYQESKSNYQLWTDLLALGKRIWATAGYDQHSLPTAHTLNVIYSHEKNNAAYVSYLAQGDFVCGGVGIRMAIGDATMGGHTDFNGKRVVFSVGDFHSTVAVEGHKYRVDVISDQGVVYSQEITTDTTYFAFDADESVSFYRVEVHDESLGDTLLAIGNPIWND